MQPGDADIVEFAVDMGREVLLITIEISLPVLGIGMLVGLVVSILQAATQIQEQTLALVPKMFAVVGTVIVIMPWILIRLMDYTEGLILDLPRMFAPFH